jgi:hypothetical protein
MKAAVVAGVVLCVFALGFGVGHHLGEGLQETSSKSDLDPPNNAKARSPKVRAGVPARTNSGGSKASQKTPAAASSGQSNFRPANPLQKSARGILAPLNNNKNTAPSPISPGALAEGEKIKRELDQNKGRGNGRVSTLVYDFDSPEDQAKWEAKRRKRWQDRLAYEIDIKLRNLRQKVGLTSAQARNINEILQKENKERMRLVDLLTAKQISRSSFDDAVQKNVKTGRQAVKAVLSEQQWQAYLQLKPREQVLRDELK